MTEKGTSPASPTPSFYSLVPDVGKLFLFMRIFAALLIAVWLFSVIAQVEEIDFIAGDLIESIVPLILWFVLYSLFLHLLSWRLPARRAACFTAMSVLDAIFVTLLVHFTGKLQSSFFLAYYLLIITSTFSLGLAAGAAITFLSTLGYLAVFVETPNSLFVGDLLMRVGFLYFVFFAMSLLSESERDKLRLGESRRKLEDTVEELVDEVEARDKTVEETSELLRFQREVTERRQDHLRFAKEINALNEIDEIVLRFHRYISRLVSADDVSLALINRDGTPPTLYAVADGKISKSDLPKDHPVLKEMLEGNIGDEELKKWNAESGAVLPAELTVIDLPVKSMWAETLSGGEGGITGVLIVSRHRRIEADPDRMDEVRILSSHCAVAIENLKLRERLEEMADTDALTGIFNRRHFQHALERELRRAERYGRPLGLIMMDIDHFKDLNDEYGHPAGDAVLKELARVVSEAVRNIDVFARYGGEEFAVVLPETSLIGSAEVAERLRRKVEDNLFPISEKETVQISISLGVGAYPAAKDTEALIRAADEALYRAKEAGRNRVEKAEEEQDANNDENEQE
ncbi:MAG: diguanylate cyclase [bacterium]